MRFTETAMISLASMLLVALMPVNAYHLDSKASSQEKLSRHVRAIEAASIQPQQQQQQQQQQQLISEQQDSQSMYGRSGELDFLDEPLKLPSSSGGGAGAEQRLSRLFSTSPLDKTRYFFPVHDVFSGRFGSGGRWVQGSGYPRVGKADSNFIRFGRSFSGGSKKNNFIRLGRENPRQTNFIRLGRSGPWDSSERFLPKVGFFPDYYSLGSHWTTRPKDYSPNHDLPSYEDGLN